MEWLYRLLLHLKTKESRARARAEDAIGSLLDASLSLASLFSLPRAHGSRRSLIPCRNGKEDAAQPFQKRPRFFVSSSAVKPFFHSRPSIFFAPRPRPPLLGKKEKEKERKEQAPSWPKSPRSRAPRPRPTAVPSLPSSSSTPTAAAPSAAAGGPPGRASTSASLSASTVPASFLPFLFRLSFSFCLFLLSSSSFLLPETDKANKALTWIITLYSRKKQTLTTTTTTTTGVHRSLGTHISKVRSATLDTWLPAQVAFAARMGNARAALFWEAELPTGFARPAEGDMAALSKFIGDKYR